MKRVQGSANDATTALGVSFHVSGRTGFAVKPLGMGETFEIGADSIEFVIHFRPFLTREQAARVRVATSVGNFAQTVVPIEAVPVEVLVLREEELEYEVFETHQIKVSNKRRTVECMYMCLENNNTDPNGGLRISPRVDMKMTFLREASSGRAHFLKWFPSDVDPALYALKIDPRAIPQRTPLWFKLRGEVSGTKAYTLLGFFAGKEKEVISARSKSNMRLGSLSEEYIIQVYLDHYPHKVFREVGWCPAATPPYPPSWGASPDGQVDDPTMTWDQVPQEIAQHYTEEERAKMDITRGACEFKTSRSKLCMEDYFYPQVYMEMIALNVVWTDLVRFRKATVYDEQEGGGWRHEDVAHVYRIWRHKPTEELFVKLWKYAHSNISRHAAILKEEQFVKIRDYLSQLAESLSPTEKITVRPNMYEKYEAHRQKLLKPVAALVGAEAVDEQDDLEWAHLAARASKLCKRSPHKEVLSVVEGYIHLLKGN